jgi:DNA repair ATPase RecN
MSTPYNFKLLMKYAGIFFLFFCLLVPTEGRTEEGNAVKSSSSKTEIQEAEGFRQKNNLVDLLNYITDLSKRFIELESQIDESGILSQFQNDLSEISYEIQLLSRQVSTISVNVEINYHQFEIVETKAYKLGYQIKKVNTQLFEIIDNLSKSNTEWEQKKKALDRWEEIAEE